MRTLLKFLVFLALLGGAVFAGIKFWALPKAETLITKQVENLGYNNVAIEGITIHPDGFAIGKILFGPDHFNSAENIAMQVDWPDFVLKGLITTLTINKIQLASITDDANDLLRYQQEFDIAKLADIPAKKINLRSLVWDTATPQGALRLESVATLSNESDKTIINAQLNAQQKQLGFASQWQGLIDEQRNIQLDGKFDGFNVKYGPMQINRGTGWLSYSRQGEIVHLAGQLEAGSGKMFAIPMSKISLVIGQEDDHYPILFRAQASGMESVRLATDISYAHTIDKQSFKTTFNIDDPQEFLRHLEEQNLITAGKANAITIKDHTDVMLTYLPEKRFADGPIPFDLVVANRAINVLNGTFLIYPDSLDVRGTVQSNEEMIKVLKVLSIATDQNITDNSVRLDGSLKQMIETNYN
jgi:hypothetical protein